MENEEIASTINLSTDSLGFMEVLSSESNIAKPQGAKLPFFPKPNFSKITNLLKISRPNFGRKPKPLDEFNSQEGSYKTSNKMSFKKKPLFIALGVFVVLIIGAGVLMLSGNKNSSGATLGDKRAEIPSAKSRQDIARLFEFPIKDGSGKVVTKIQYSIENAELHDQIVVQGQQATAIKGKTFLVINLKITNTFDKPIQINTKDYIRLTRNDSAEQLAADIHNDPVTIQPISTKYTRVGFAINDNDKNLKLGVGEINGQKVTIDINL